MERSTWTEVPGILRLPFWIMMNVGASSRHLQRPSLASRRPCRAGASAASRRERPAVIGTLMCLPSSSAAAQEKIFAEHPGLSLEELVREKGEHYAPPLYLSFSHLRPDMGMQKRILKIGLPQAVEVFGMWGIQMFCLSIISELPITGVLGVHNIAVRIESLSASCPASPSAWQPPHWWGSTWAPGMR